MKSLTRQLTMNVPARMDFVNITPEVERARRQGVIKRARPVVERLRRVGLYVSDSLVERALAHLGE